MKFFIFTNWFKLFALFLMFIATISLFKISFYGIEINAAKNIDINSIILDEESKIHLIGNDLDIHEAPIWVHVETNAEYHRRLDKSIKQYEHDWKMMHDAKYRENFEKNFQKFKKEHNIKN